MVLHVSPCQNPILIYEHLGDQAGNIDSVLKNSDKIAQLYKIHKLLSPWQQGTGSLEKIPHITREQFDILFLEARNSSVKAILPNNAYTAA